jgi:hypothetical protein
MQWLLLLAFVPVLAWSQSALPRTADGKPNLSGIWQVMTTADWDIQDHQARADAPAGLGVVEGGEIPYQPWALAKKKDNFEKRAWADPLTKCYLPGVPRITYTPLPFQILQAEKQVSTRTRSASFSRMAASIPKDTSTGGRAIRAANGRETRWPWM